MAETLGEALLYLRTDDQGLDAGIDRAQTKSEGLGRTFDDASGKATNMGKAMDGAGAAATRLGERQEQLTRMTGAQRAGVQQLTANLGDMSTMYSMGMRPQQIFSTQIGQITQAIQLTAGEGSKFAAFLGGPWGIALTIAAQVGGPLIAMLLDTEDKTKKAKDGVETFADSLDRQKHSLEEVKKALADYVAGAQKARESALDNAIAAAAEADALLKNALALRQALAAKLQIAQADAEAAKKAALAQQQHGKGEGASVANQLAQDQAASLRQQQSANEAEIARLQQQVKDTHANFADELSKVVADPTLAVRRHFEQLRKDARASITDVKKLTDTLADLRKQEEAAVERASKLKHPSSSSSASADASVGDMVALIKQLFPGATITSTTGGAHTKGSDHYKGTALDFVPKGGMDTYTTAEVEQILENAGVTIRRNRNGTKQIFGPGRSAEKPGDHDDHFHIAWQGGASPEEAQRRQKAADEKIARDKEREAARVDRYTRDLAQLQDQAANLQARMADTAEERYALEKQALDVATQEQARRISSNRDYTNAEKLTLLGALAVKTSLENQLLEKRKQEELARQQLEIAQATWANERELLEKQAQLSDVRSERKAIEQKILDETYRQLEAQLRDTAANAKDEAARADARARLATLGAAKSLDQAKLNREYESPLERYRREIVGVGKNMNDEMEKVAVNGLDRLADGLTNVAMRAKSLGAAFKDVAREMLAEIINLYIKQKLILPLLGLAMGGQSKGLGSIGASLGIVAGDEVTYKDPTAAVFGKSGGGVGMIGKALGFLGKFAGFFADGGLIPAGGFGIVGEAGPEPVFASPGGGVGVMPNSALRSMGSARGGERDLVEVRIIDTTGLFQSEVHRISSANVRSGIAAYDTTVGDRVQEHLERFG